MNIESIPKTLWHSISISIIVATIGFTYITYRAESFSLKYKGVELITQGNEARALNLDKQSIMLKEWEHELEELRKLYDEKIEELEEANRKVTALTRKSDTDAIDKSELVTVLQGIKSVSVPIDLIKEKQDNLKVLSKQQQLLQEQESNIFQQLLLQQQF